MAIFFFARVMRAAIVASLTRKARPTSAVVEPADQAKGQRDLGVDGNGGVTAGEDEAEPVVDDFGLVQLFGPGHLHPFDEQGKGPVECGARRATSMARRRATVVNHAPGFVGIPPVDQVASARA